MRRNFGQSNTAWVFWATSLVIGFGCLVAQAADDRDALHFYQTPLFAVTCAVGLLICVGIAWRAMNSWRTRVMRQRDADMVELVNQWTRSLQQEVAERKEAQRALHESQDLNIRQERLAAVGQLAAGLAHEFNNILTIIQGHASLLLDNPNLDQDSIDSITHITEGVERTATLVKQMLAFSRKQVMQQEVVAIEHAMNEVSDILRRLVGAHIVLRFDIAANVPPIKADPQMLQQIIANLAVNARDVMTSGGQLIIGASEVVLDEESLDAKPGRRPGRFVELTVADTGPGMDQTVIKHLFEPFFTTKDVGKGTGLGLATVYGMVTQNGGWIEVESEVGVGTTFKIYFQATEKPMESAKAKKPAPEKKESAPKSGGETILVVEDEVDLRELVRDVLAVSGYNVLEAGSGVEALQVWGKNRNSIKLLLTDMSMPDGMSGGVLAAKLVKDNPHLPIIFSSGYSQANLDGAEYSGPGRSFLSKPYHPADLARSVRTALDSAAGGQAPLTSPKT